MANITPKNINIGSAARFFDEIQNSTEDAFYIFVGNHTPFDDDSEPPLPDNSPYNVGYNVFDEMMFLKRVQPADVALMVNKSVWTSNTEYQRWDSDLNDLANEDFFVVADEAGSYHVFLCLNNKDGIASTSKPLLSETSPDDVSYVKLVDDYQWKFLYTISASDYNKFSTDNFMPVFANTAVAAAAVNGAIEVIVVDNAGTGYNSYTEGTFSDFSIGGNNRIYALDASASANASFYDGCSIYIKSGAGAGQLRQILDYVISGTQKKIVLDSAFDDPVDLTSEYEITPYVIIEGNGEGATARALVNATGNTIDRVEIITRGENYSYANVTITGNTGIINVTSNTAIVADEAVARVIISPLGGHGANNFKELYADKVGISVTISNTESGVLPISNDFRTIGLVKNPLLANVELAISSSNGSLLADMEVTQATTGAKGVLSFANSTVLRVTRVQGSFDTGYRISNDANTAISANVTTVSGQDNVIDASTTLAITITDNGVFANGFALDEQVTQGENASGYVYHANTTTLKLTRVKGTFVPAVTVIGETSEAEASVASVTEPDIVRYTGEVLYIENMEPVQRAADQSETAKLIISF